RGMAARRRRQTHARHSTHVLGWLYVSQRGYDQSPDLERRAARHAQGARSSRVELMKKLNVGLVGYGFMGRTHSNAFRQAGKFFDLPYEPVLKTVCARNAERGKAFAANWGFENAITD